MTVAKTADPMSTERQRVADRARNEQQGRFPALARLIDVAALKDAYNRLRPEAAVGVDGVSKAEYGQDLESRLEELHQRMVGKRYRHQPIKRVYLPKDNGTKRPIGISTTEDKVVQGALREVLELVYEPIFHPDSYGFRPGRSAHDALRRLNQVVHKGGVSAILEADIVSFFDSVDRTKLKEMLEIRVADGSMLRLIGKCLHVGVLDGEEYTEPGEGTTQGSGLSPLLGNIYLHYVLDTWFEEQVKPRLRGRAYLIRYADDFVLGFEHMEDAHRVKEVLPQRMGKYGLSLHPDKTRLLSFEPPTRQGGDKGTTTLDFLGFTCYWRKTHRGGWKMWCKTRRGRLSRAIDRVYSFCKKSRHRPVKEQHARLSSRLRGHYNYFGVNGNYSSLWQLYHRAKKSWFKWLRRRSQRTRMTWERFGALLGNWALPKPRIKVTIWT
jgi:RNA-directed DNA polymerase